MNAEVSIHFGLAGRYRFTVRDGKTLAIKTETPWIDNIITDIGLNRVGSGSTFASSIQVGSGSTPPATNNTQLQTYIAGTSTVLNETVSAQSVAPYFSRRTRTWRFNAGQAAGTLAEVGVGWTTTTGNLFSRALILDANGLPTTITVLADEVLDVTYELRVYPPTTDKVFQTTIDGIVRDCVLRAMLVTDTTYWVGGIAHVLFNGINTRGQPGWVYNGTIGAITGSPSGTPSASSAQGAFAAYVNNSMERRLNYSFGLNEGNLPGGVSATIYQTNIGSYQMSFSPPIAKDATKVMSFAIMISWGRYNP